ncbi:MAG: phosphatase PAP2 family protein [Chloroflexota bacterium]|nr:MAG: phosphatase PAP2 family protein [Chloroflexota bacterium]
MDYLYDLGISIVLFVQNLGAWMISPIRFISFFGTAEFYLLIMPALYWCFDAALGFRIGIILLVSDGLNFILKVAFHTARPFWFSRQVTSYSFESSFGIPSGHAQNSAAVFGLLAASLKRRWVWVVCLIAIFLIGLSRIYLAVHFPQDVILGWIIGFILVWIFLRLEGPVSSWFTRQSLGAGILAIFVFSMGILIIGLLVREISSGWQIPQTWIENARLAFPDEDPIDPFRVSPLLLTTGVLFGLAAGGFWISTRGGFDAKGIWWKRILRFVVGVIGVVILWMGLGAVLPEPNALLGYVLYYLQYALIGLWVSALAPWLFVRLNLAERK